MRRNAVFAAVHHSVRMLFLFPFARVSSPYTCLHDSAKNMPHAPLYSFLSLCSLLPPRSLFIIIGTPCLLSLAPSCDLSYFALSLYVSGGRCALVCGGVALRFLNRQEHHHPSSAHPSPFFSFIPICSLPVCAMRSTPTFILICFATLYSFFCYNHAAPPSLPRGSASSLSLCVRCRPSLRRRPSPEHVVWCRWQTRGMQHRAKPIATTSLSLSLSPRPHASVGTTHLPQGGGTAGLTCNPANILADVHVRLSATQRDDCGTPARTTSSSTSTAPPNVSLLVLFSQLCSCFLFLPIFLFPPLTCLLLFCTVQSWLHLHS